VINENMKLRAFEDVRCNNWCGFPVGDAHAEHGTPAPSSRDADGPFSSWRVEVARACPTMLAAPGVEHVVVNLHHLGE
jgi:hypothetical protein